VSAADAPKLDPCGCCEAGVPQPRLHNRPGLPVLDYRIGTHPTFLRRALDHLPSQTVPPGDPGGARPLADLTTRSGDDPAIALLDAWATVADVLTFYQERIANEGYLRTATERRSVLELARAIGYEINPGVAASTFLAFTVEDAPGAPDVATVPQGTKVQSIPDQGQQLPQTFETSAQLTARAEWNALRPRLSHPQDLAVREDSSGRLKLYLLGARREPAANTPDPEKIPVGEVYPLDPAIRLPEDEEEVHAAEVEQVYLAGTSTNLEVGELLLLVGKRSSGDVKTLALPITGVEAEAESDRTRVELGGRRGLADQPSRLSFVPSPLEPGVISLDALPFDKEHVDGMVLLDKDHAVGMVRERIWRERDLSAFLSIQGWSALDMLEYINTSAPIGRPPPAPSPADKEVEEMDAGAFVFRTRVGFFGHNAPQWDTLPANQRFGEKVQTSEYEVEYVQGAYRNSWDDPYGWEIWKRYPDNTLYSSLAGHADVYLERTFPDITEETWAVFESPVGERYTPYWVTGTNERSVTGFALSARATGLMLGSGVKPSAFKVRSTTAHVQSQRLGLAQLPIEERVTEGSTYLQLDRMVLGLQADQPLVLNGERDDLPGVTSNEIVILADIHHIGGFTTLYFKEGLQHSYIRKTVTLNANVARATHGETVVEALGSGDGARPNQGFTLKKPPLTYVSAANARGSESTLRVQVDGVYWREAPRLYDLDGRSKSFMVRIEDDGETRVVFGDGTRGASLPTGMENVVATYRSGIGFSGVVGADKLTLLQTRPLGIRGVTNPLPAGGADDPESRDGARSNAPLASLTLDRIVSLRDFEDFARTFAGIGKAQAVALWKGGTRLVHITIAAVAPTTAPDAPGAGSVLATNLVERSSPLYANLVEAIRGASDTTQRFQIDSYQPLFFNVKAKVLVERPAYTPTTVLGGVESALKAAFSFERRDFGQPVTAAEVVTVIQGVPGVVATDLDQLYRYRDKESPSDPESQDTPEILEAERVRLKDDRIALAQLLLINPAGIRLEEMRP
jgi:hypothetical protein